MAGFINYYRILSIGRHASRRDIRASFRKLAKKFHPDTSTLDPETAAVRMRVLLEAYRILSDNDKRTAYNLRFKSRLEKPTASYRETLRERADDPYAQALLIFYDLLNGKGESAVFNYERMREGNGGSFELLPLLGFADYLDCIFLLAEEYQKQARFEQAVRYYAEALQEDRKWNYLRRLRPEIKQRIRNIYCRHLARQAEPQEAIGYYFKLLKEYDFPKKERAFFHKKTAEAYCDLDDIPSARRHLDRAFRLKPNLSGTRKILQRLNMEI
jgi:tetratricopeptide (TPR) repeat protein